jgi:hypothetical protein
MRHIDFFDTTRWERFSAGVPLDVKRKVSLENAPRTLFPNVESKALGDPAAQERGS